KIVPGTLDALFAFAIPSAAGLSMTTMSALLELSAWSTWVTDPYSANVAAGALSSTQNSLVVRVCAAIRRPVLFKSSAVQVVVAAQVFVASLACFRTPWFD